MLIYTYPNDQITSQRVQLNEIKLASIVTGPTCKQFRRHIAETHSDNQRFIKSPFNATNTSDLKRF